MEEENVSGEQTAEVAAPASEVHETPQEQISGERESNVPLSALQSERAQRQKLQEELQMVKDHIALMQSQHQPQTPKKEEPSYDKDDVPTWGEVQEYISKREGQYQSQYEEMRMAQKYPDYKDVILKYLPEVVKANPGLRSNLEKTQDYELAYYLARNSDQYKRDHQVKKQSVEAQRILENSEKAGSLSSMGSTSPISQAKQYKQMSDDEFKNLVNKNMGFA